MRTVRDILEYKGSSVWSVRPDDTVLHALGVMARQDIGAVVVLDGDRLCGILTERDYARRVVLAGRSSKDSAIRDVMTPEVLCVPPDATIDECLAVMTDKRLRHLPVTESGVVIGLVSIGDLVRARIAEQEYVIEQLQLYISG